MPTELTVLHRDDALVVVDKPAGLLVHRGLANDAVTVVDLLRTALAGEAHPVHRLDRGTSGVLVFARSSVAASRLGAEFAEGRVEKRYVAIVRGCPPDETDVDHPIPKCEGGARVAARTIIRRLATADLGADAGGHVLRVSLIEAIPMTGRFHQVRRHARHLGHPLVGDVNYGRGEINRLFRDRYAFKRLALHAASIGFAHPVAGTRLHVAAPLARDFAAVLDALEIRYFERL